MGIIRRTYTFLNEETFLLLYKALVSPHLEFACAAWHSYKQKDIEAMENVQRRATRQLASLKNLSYEERLEKLKLPTLSYRRLRGDMIEVYKILGGHYDPSLCDILPASGVTHTRGHAKKLYKFRSRLDTRKYSFTQRVVDQWNSLPEEVVDAPSIYAFKTRLDKHWQDLSL